MKLLIGTLTLILMLGLSGCGMVRFPKLSTPKPPDTVYNWMETQRTTPKAVVVGGKVVVVEESERILQVGLTVAPKQLTFIERVGNWISGLGLIAVIALVIGLFVAPGATIAILLKVVKKWKRAMKQTVLAVRESGAVNDGNGLHTALSSKQCNETKRIVSEIKLKD